MSRKPRRFWKRETVRKLSALMLGSLHLTSANPVPSEVDLTTNDPTSTQIQSIIPRDSATKVSKAASSYQTILYDGTLTLTSPITIYPTSMYVNMRKLFIYL